MNEELQEKLSGCKATPNKFCECISQATWMQNEIDKFNIGVFSKQIGKEILGVAFKWLTYKIKISSISSCIFYSTKYFKATS